MPALIFFGINPSTEPKMPIHLYFFGVSELPTGEMLSCPNGQRDLGGANLYIVLSAGGNGHPPRSLIGH